MARPVKQLLKQLRGPSLACAGLLALGASSSAFAEYPVTTMQTAIDRIQIEDMLINYAWESQEIKPGLNLDWFYTEDCVIESNGVVMKGRKTLDEFLKQSISSGKPIGPPIVGKFFGITSIPKIRVNGNTATAKTVWWGMVAETVKLHPRLIEVGREYDELVKQDGHWLVKHRVIMNDGGMPDQYDKTYKPVDPPF